jgi:hypothetical protein
LGFTVEDLARTALLRIVARNRFRLAAQSDSRFQSFAKNTARIAYRQQGGTPAFLLFSGPGQDPRAAAIAAAAWAEANWRPNAIQRSVRPGVVVVQVAAGPQLITAGPVAGATVPAAVWTVDSDTGRVEVSGSPPGSPSASDVKHAAAALAQGLPPPSLGELDLAERAVMQVRTRGMPRSVSGVVAVLLVIFALRYGIGGLFSLMILPNLLQGNVATLPAGKLILLATLSVNVVMLAGIVLGLGIFFNIRNLAFRAPGFSSPTPRTRNLAWGGYAAIMIGLAVVLDGVLPAMERSSIAATNHGDYSHVSATTADDGGEAYVAVGGDLSVDLSGWPSSEWSGVQFKTSNPSVLTLDAPATGGRPVVRFSAHQQGVSRVDASSSDGRYTFQLRVNVITV